MYRKKNGQLEVLLGHPGGPFYQRRDDGAWSIPKGVPERGESLLEAAKREFEEETGILPKGPFMALTPVLQRSGRIVYAWAFEGDCDPNDVVSNLVTVNLPSGRTVEFPEMDRSDFFGLGLARLKINGGQRPLIDELERRLSECRLSPIAENGESSAHRRSPAP